MITESANKNIRSAAQIKEGLLTRAFNGQSKYSYEQMQQMIAECEERIRSAPSAAEVLSAAFTRISGDTDIPDPTKITEIMSNTNSRYLNAVNMLSYVERYKNDNFFTVFLEQKPAENDVGDPSDALPNIPKRLLN